jgi:hypothetical protein
MQIFIMICLSKNVCNRDQHIAEGYDTFLFYLKF